MTEFPWHSTSVATGSLLHTLAEAKEFCTTALKRKIFKRGDYRYLCELVAFFLGGDLEFRCRQVLFSKVLGGLQLYACLVHAAKIALAA